MKLLEPDFPVLAVILEITPIDEPRFGENRAFFRQLLIVQLFD